VATNFILGLLVSGVAMAQTAGTFTPTGNMTTPRSNHTATLLPDGNVLIAGGVQKLSPDLTPLSSAELYDPSTGSFTPTGSTNTARSQHTATLLPNGKVLVAGGYRPNSTEAVVSSELYDPATGTFTVTGDMITARYWFSATLLDNGKVLIAGGHDRSTSYANLSSAELYDPSTGTFARTGDMVAPQARHKAILLPNGKVLIVPGDETIDVLRAQLYDPVAGTFSATDWRDVSDMVAATMDLLPNGTVLLTLNVQECDFLSTTAELYDSSTGVFTATGIMPFGICRPTGTRLSDGTVLIAGGWFNFTANAQLYDPATGAFSPTGDMTTGRHEHTATLLPDGKVLIAGGMSGCGFCGFSVLNSAELYNPSFVMPAPAMVRVAGDRPGHGAILHTDTHQPVSPTNPAIAGEALEIYCTGLIDDSIIPPQVVIGGRMAEILYFGNAPGLAGLNQINVRVPSGSVAGSAVSVRLTYLDRSSNEVTISVQ
jgi:Galactose oxidase, central domain